MASFFSRLFSSRSTPMDSADVDQWLSHSRQSLLAHLSTHDRFRLAELAHRFRSRCEIRGAEGFSLNEAMCQQIAVEACLPVLNLGLDAYAGVQSVVLYPGGFIANDSWADEDGVVHEWKSPLSGSAFDNGPVLLAWDEVANPEPQTQVVIHEFAHVLDAGNGLVNGFPDVREPFLRHAWPDVFSSAYHDLVHRVEHELPLTIDAYAAESPAECFAVMCETFFTAPGQLINAYPAVYELLAAYFEQEPQPLNTTTSDR